jgi:flavin-binding protein dodecin
MTVQKAVDVRGEGATLEAAVEEALDRAALTLEGITAFHVRHMRGTLDSGRPLYQVEVRVWFTLLDRFHE